MEKKKEPSYNQLKECLKCANEEAKGYLGEVVALRKDVERLQGYKDIASLMERICRVQLNYIALLESGRR